MIFIYFALLINLYLVAFFIALFVEYPFRTMAKIVFSPPQKIIRLTEDLANELNVANMGEESESEIE